MPALLLGIVFAIWVYRVAARAGARAWLWALGTFLIWPVFSIVAGIRFRERGLYLVPIVGILALLAVGAYSEGVSGANAAPLAIAVLVALWFAPGIWILVEHHSGRFAKDVEAKPPFPLGTVLVTFGIPAILGILFLMFFFARSEVSDFKAKQRTMEVQPETSTSRDAK